MIHLRSFAWAFAWPFRWGLALLLIVLAIVLMSACYLWPEEEKEEDWCGI